MGHEQGRIQPLAALRIGGLLLAWDGKCPHQAVMNLVERNLQIAKPGQAIPPQVVKARMTKVLKPMLADEVVLWRAKTLYAPNLADLAAWMADEYARREDVGSALDPEIPALSPNDSTSG